VAHDLLGHTAEQHPLNSTATMAAYHNEVGRPPLGNFHDAHGRMPAFHIVLGGYWQRQSLMQAAKQSLTVLNGSSDQFFCRRCVTRGVARRYCNAVDQRHLRTEQACEFGTDLGGVRGCSLAIDCNKDFAERHNLSPCVNNSS
jgi:hypothetical protein